MKDTAIIIQADIDHAAIEEAQLMAELKNAAKRQAEKLATYKAWVEPKAIKARREQHEKDAAAALARGEDLAKVIKEQKAERDLLRSLGLWVKPPSSFRIKE